MNYIFFGVDKVLNCRNTNILSPKEKIFVDDEKVERLISLAKKMDAKLVLSSSWRYDRNDKNQNADYLALVNKFEEFGGNIADCTIILERINKKYTRADEIKRYLTSHRVELGYYIILDKSDSFFNDDILARTNTRYNFTYDYYKLDNGLTEEIEQEILDNFSKRDIQVMS